MLPPAVRGAAPGMVRVSSDAHERDVRCLPARACYLTTVFLHGGTGIGKIDFLDALGRADLAVIAPDSFALQSRLLQGELGKQLVDRNLFCADFRSAELTYALERLPEQS